MKRKYYANSKRQDLKQHLALVGSLAGLLAYKITGDLTIVRACYKSGTIHDVAKSLQEIQEYFYSICIDEELENEELGQNIASKGYSFENNVTHQEISFVIARLFYKENSSMNRYLKDLIYNGVFCHHAMPKREEKLNDVADVCKILKKKLGKDKFLEFVNNCIEFLNGVFQELADKCSVLECVAKDVYVKKDKVTMGDLEDIYDIRLPKYKSYLNCDDFEDFRQEIDNNSNYSIVRGFVNSADRFVSTLSAEKLSELFDSLGDEEYMNNVVSSMRIDDALGLSCSIEEAVAKFGDSERTKAQKEICLKMFDNHAQVTSLSGPAGCGKTILALMYANLMSPNKKIVFVGPRKAVVESLYIELKGYLPRAKVEMLTGNIKSTSQDGVDCETDPSEYFSGDVVITTIDQISSYVSNHKKTTGLVSFLDSVVIFDEFHEVASTEVLQLLFAELVACKRKVNNGANVLLVSATPSKCYVEDILCIKEYDMFKMPTFNPSEYRLNIVDYKESDPDTNPFFQHYESKKIVINEIAATIQQSYLRLSDEENSALITGKLCEDDMAVMMKRIIKSFGKNGDGAIDVLRGSSILNSSLNISADSLLTTFGVIEDILQRIGRILRFAQVHGIADIDIAIPMGKKGSLCTFLRSVYKYKSSMAAVSFIKKTVKRKKSNQFTIDELYDLYDEFYNDRDCRKVVADDLLCSLKKSAKLINKKLSHFVSVKCAPDTKAKGEASISGSLRGYSCYIKSATASYDCRNGVKYLDEYKGDEVSMTMGVQELSGHGVEERSIISEMARTCHKVIKGVKKPYKDAFLIWDAKKRSKPIYTSYTGEDIKGTSVNRSPFAKYYMVTDKQPVGIMNIDKVLYLKTNSKKKED